MSLLANQYSDECLCIVGDFNAVREIDERRGRGHSWDNNDILNFNNFVLGSNLMEIQLVGRSFTWYHPDGTCKSKLDRMLVNLTWSQTWPNQLMKGGKRSLSDHVPIFIDEVVKDWGPKPFRFFNQWIQHPTFCEFVAEKWNSFDIQG